MLLQKQNKKDKESFPGFVINDKCHVVKKDYICVK